MLVARRTINEVRFIVGGLLPHSSRETHCLNRGPKLVAHSIDAGGVLRVRIVQEHGRCQQRKWTCQAATYCPTTTYSGQAGTALCRWPATFVQRRYVLRKFYMVQIHARGGERVGITSRLLRRYTRKSLSSMVITRWRG